MWVRYFRRPVPMLSRSTYLRRRVAAALLVLAAIVVPVALHERSASPTPRATVTRRSTPGHADLTGTSTPSTLPPAGPTTLSTNIYAADGPDMFSPAVSGQLTRLYVPNSSDHSVDVIDPTTRKVIDRFRVGRNPQHVVPSWDLQTLYVANDLSNSLTPIDPRTGRPSGDAIAVDDPYNLYFTPDGASAIVVAEARGDLDFRDPHTFALQDRLHVDCRGVDHMDFDATGSYLIASCEFSGLLVKVDLRSKQVLGYLAVGGAPQDVKVDPDGSMFYVANMTENGLNEIDGASMTQLGFLPTGPETHGLYPSRDARFLYVSNRGGITRNAGSVSVVDFASRQVVATWPVPGGGTPDMGGVSADGSTLWLTGRRSNVVYGFDTRSGAVVARIPVGPGPHGMCVWPQPGRYSLGHTGNLR